MTTTLTPNIPLIRKVLAQIDAHPDLHNQRDFDSTVWDDNDEPCGTAFCFAGWAVVLSDGYRYDAERQIFLGPEDRYVSPDESARNLLGITPDEAWGDASGLFCAGITRDDIQRIAERIAANAGEAL